MNFGEELGLQLMLAHKSYQQYLSRILNRPDVFQNHQLLLQLSRAGGQSTQKKLCDELQIEKSNMAAIIGLLKQKGYITQRINFKDRRGKLISLTPLGMQFIDELNEALAGIERDIFKELTWQEMYNCLRVLTKVNDRFKMPVTKARAAAASGEIDR